MLGRQKCIGCGRLSPETNGDTTLTTSYGWRIRKGVDEAGAAAVEWRCPPCWQKFKASQAGQGGSTSSMPSVNAPGIVTLPPISTTRPGPGPDGKSS